MIDLYIINDAWVLFRYCIYISIWIRLGSIRVSFAPTCFQWSNITCQYRRDLNSDRNVMHKFTFLYTLETKFEGLFSVNFNIFYDYIFKVSSSIKVQLLFEPCYLYMSKCARITFADSSLSLRCRKYRLTETAGRSCAHTSSWFSLCGLGMQI